jgi:PIN domain nuclease of toxin-antitoxin system
VQLLLDTQALLWWLADDPWLSSSARKIISRPTNTVMVSAASAWEIAIKVRLGKLRGAEELASEFADRLAAEKFQELNITSDHAIRAGFLAGPHKDPFDRMLVAQSQAENLPLISNDEIFDSYKVRRIW